MHLWCTASQQVDERRVEGHDGIAHVHHLLLIVTISRPERREGAELVKADRSERTSGLINVAPSSYTSEQTPWTEPGRSRAGVSEILMASFMAASNPFPPSPRSAGPKHSGRRMSSLTTTLEFSSTLSPGKSNVEGEATAQGIKGPTLAFFEMQTAREQK